MYYARKCRRPLLLDHHLHPFCLCRFTIHHILGHFLKECQNIHSIRIQIGQQTHQVVFWKWLWTYIHIDDQHSTVNSVSIYPEQKLQSEYILFQFQYLTKRVQNEWVVSKLLDGHPLYAKPIASNFGLLDSQSALPIQPGQRSYSDKFIVLFTKFHNTFQFHKTKLFQFHACEPPFIRH